MKNPTLLSVLAGGAAGIVAAGATVLLLTPAEAPSASAPASSVETVAVRTAEADERDALARELDLMRAETSALAQRLAALEDRPAPADGARQPVPVEPDPAAARLEQEMKQLLAALGSEDQPVPEALVSSVREVVENLQDEERAEREQQWAQAREQELNARMERYEEELGLDRYQSDEMRAILVREREKRDALLAEVRENGTWMTQRDELFGSMRTLREESNTALANVLTPDQMGRYEELDRSRFGFGGGPGGGGSGGGDGPGGARRF